MSIFEGLQLNRFRSKRRKIANSEYHAANFIPYLCHYNANTIMTKSKDLITVIKVLGFSFETADDIDLMLKKEARNNLFKGCGSGQFALYFHTIRKKHEAYPDGNFTDPICKGIDEEWKLRHKKDYTFINEHYITIIRKFNKIEQGFAKFSNIIKGNKVGTKKFGDENIEDDEIDLEKLKKELTKEEMDKLEDQVMKENLIQLEEVRDRFANSLSSYQAKILGAVYEDHGCYCEILEFLSSIPNCLQIQKTLLPNIPLDKYIPRSRLYFSGKTGEALTIDGKTKYFAMVGLKDYRNTTYPGMLDAFLHLPFEFIITQSYYFTDKMIVINKIQLQQRRLVQSDDVAVSQIAEINEALDSAMSGAFAFGNHHLTIMCITDGVKELDSAVSQATVAFSNIGVGSVRENFNMEPAFWAQLPANDGYIGRKATINTQNLASFASLHNYPPGKRKGNHWGDAVTVFNTASGTPYFFSFHVRDVGHTMIVGPTGAGKTVLMNFLCAQAQKFHPKIFFFDKDHGAEIFIRAIGGNYIMISASDKTGFNPLQIEDTYENKTFLQSWFATLIASDGVQVTADDYAVIKQAVDGNFKLPKEQRNLATVAAFFGMEKAGSLANRISRWHSDGAKAKLFDNINDNIDFNRGKVFGFEMGELLKDKISLAPTLEYLFHRISDSLDGSPTMIVLDEAWALIDNPVFGPKIKDWLKVLRKLNAMVVFATQSVEDATKSSISDTLVQQTATQIFLPNLKATEAYRQIFMLTEREFSLVKNTDPGSRYFLLKQDSNAVMARVDMRGMEDVIHLLSGRIETVELLNKIREKVGDSPADWLPVFLSKLANKET